MGYFSMMETMAAAVRLVPEMKYRSSTGENSSRPERVEHTQFFWINSRPITSDYKASKKGVWSTITSTISWFANHHATLQKKKRWAMSESVATETKEEKKQSSEICKKKKNIKACVHFLSVCYFPKATTQCN